MKLADICDLKNAGLNDIQSETLLDVLNGHDYCIYCDENKNFYLHDMHEISMSAEESSEPLENIVNTAVTFMYDLLECEEQRASEGIDASRWIESYTIEGIEREEINKRYNIDAIIHCFRNGLETYLSGFSVLWSYEEIGKVFTCSYEIE